MKLPLSNLIMMSVISVLTILNIYTYQELAVANNQTDQANDQTDQAIKIGTQVTNELKKLSVSLKKTTASLRDCNDLLEASMNTSVTINPTKLRK